MKFRWISGRGPIDTPASAPHLTIEQRYEAAIAAWNTMRGRTKDRTPEQGQRERDLANALNAGLDIERLCWARWLARHPRGVS